MTLIASDGYEYEDLTQRLLGNPLANQRNAQLKAYRRASDLFSREEIDAWQKAYDGQKIGDFYARHSFGRTAIRDVAARTNAKNFGELIDRVDRAAFTTLSRPVHATS